MTFPTVLFLSYFLPTVHFFLCNLLCASLCTSSLCWCLLLTFFPPFLSPMHVSLHFGGRCGGISQMYVLYNRKNPEFLQHFSIFHGKNREKTHTEWRTANSPATAHSEQGLGRSACRFWVWLKQKSLNNDFQQLWSPPASTMCFSSSGICLPTKTEQQRMRGSKTNFVRIIFYGMGD